MTFSQSVKMEILKNMSDLSPCCITAFLAAVIRSTGSLELSFGGIGFSLSSENKNLLKTISINLKKLYNVEASILEEKSARLKKDRTVYTLKIEKSENILKDTGLIYIDENGLRQLADGVDKYIISNECCAKTFIKGMFLGCGAIELPLNEKQVGYHLEFDLNSLSVANGLIETLDYFNFVGKVIPKKNSFIVYIKDSEIISDLLAFMGANKGVMELQNLLATRSVRNTINRQTNCYAANVERSVAAAVAQINAINKIKSTTGLQSLSPKLRELAEIRLEFPSATLDELVLKVGDTSRSGINHRLRKIVSLAELI